MKYFIYCRKSSESEDRQVMSLESQREALDRAFIAKGDIEIVDVFVEAKSAKNPGRPIFAEMIRRIEAGEAQGIMSWAPDRLARNSIDGGHVVHLLDRGLLRDLKFATYTFENNSQGKFMLSIMFGQSKYYSDALSDNVKRGNETKIKNGWRPNRAPLGYVNDAESRTIICHETHFPMVRRMFEMVLYEGLNPRQVAQIARDEWGFTTPKSKRSGGTPMAPATIYKMLSNPFYKGINVWGGEHYVGRHQPMVTAQEFAGVQAIVRGGKATRSKERVFTYTGLITCGACGKRVTAEAKTNAYGLKYVYYHCSARSRKFGSCKERSIEERALETQISAFVYRLQIPAELADWIRHQLRDETAATAVERAAQSQSQEASKEDAKAQLAELTSLRLRKLVSDEEFLERRQELTDRFDRAGSAPASQVRDLFELFEMVEKLTNSAVYTFAAGLEDQKRAMLKLVCSNFSLMGKKLSIQAAAPLCDMDEINKYLRQRTVVDDVRTFSGRESGTLPLKSKLSGARMLTARQVRTIGNRYIERLEGFALNSDHLQVMEGLRRAAECSNFDRQAKPPIISSTPKPAWRRRGPRRGSVVGPSHARKRPRSRPSAGRKLS